jgi:CRISPR associated protein Cas1
MPPARKSIPYRLGLDLGTNSIGWCITDLGKPDKDGRMHPVRIRRMGVRIFPDGRDPQSGASLAQERRLPRSARRRRDRFLDRRAGLMNLLIEHGLMPGDPAERKKLETVDPWRLRAKGLDYQLTLHEFGRAIFHLNQRRGFKSNRRTDRKEKASEAQGMKAGAAELAKRLDPEKPGQRTLGEYFYTRFRKDRTPGGTVDGTTAAMEPVRFRARFGKGGRAELRGNPHRYVVPVSQNSGSEDEYVYGRIANPTVHVGLNQVRRLLNAIIDVYGHPSEIVVELARELKQTWEERRETTERQAENRKKNERRKEQLAAAGIPMTCDAMLRMRLWEELARISQIENASILANRSASEGCSTTTKWRSSTFCLSDERLTTARPIRPWHYAAPTGTRATPDRVGSGDPENMEAQAARRYRPLLFGEAFRRDRDTAGVNAMLNYGYAVLRAATARAICGAGLHPSVGISHKNAGMCLADDLMEPFRPIVDLVAARLVAAGVSTVDGNTKKALAEISALDMRTERSRTPLFLCLERLATSLGLSYEHGKMTLDLPLAPLSLEIPTIGSVRCPDHATEA